MSGAITTNPFQLDQNGLLWNAINSRFLSWLYGIKRWNVGIKKNDISNVKWVINPIFCWLKLVHFPLDHNWTLDKKDNKIWSTDPLHKRKGIKVLKNETTCIWRFCHALTSSYLFHGLQFDVTCMWNIHRLKRIFEELSDTRSVPKIMSFHLRVKIEPF